MEFKDFEFINMEKYIKGVVKSMLGWYNVKNDNQIKIVNAIVSNILSKFICIYTSDCNNLCNTLYIYIELKNNIYDIMISENKIDKIKYIALFYILIHNKNIIQIKKYDKIYNRNLIAFYNHKK